MTPERRVGAVVAIVLAAAAGALLASRPRAPRDRHASPRTPPAAAQTLPRDGLSYVPASTVVLAVADLEALRRAPATRSLFATTPSAPPACAEALAQRVRRVLLVVPRPRLDDFAFIAEGGVSEAAFAACAQGAQSTVRDGVRIATASSGDAGGAGTIAWTPSGVMLVGPRALVDAMLQRGLDTMHGDASPLALAPLRRHANERSALWVLALPSPERVPERDPLAGVTGAAISADVRDGVTLSTTLLCEDSARARAVATTLTAIREDTLRGEAPPWVRSLLSSAAVEPDGAAVKVRATLDAAGVSGVIDGAREALRATVGVPY